MQTEFYVDVFLFTTFTVLGHLTFFLESNGYQHFLFESHRAMDK